jgi:hypothetical protein
VTKVDGRSWLLGRAKPWGEGGLQLPPFAQAREEVAKASSGLQEGWHMVAPSRRSSIQGMSLTVTFYSLTWSCTVE